MTFGATIPLPISGDLDLYLRLSSRTPWVLTAWDESAKLPSIL
jgi:hypothetical protein